MNDSLIALAQANGVILEYHDIWGTPHQPTETTLRAILTAMGVPAHDDEAVQASLAATAHAQWERPLPAALVVREDEGPWTILLRLRDDLSQSQLRWTLQEESGGVHEGRAELLALECQQTVTLGEQRYCARRLRIEPSLPCGYHRLRIDLDGRPIADSLFCVTPRRSYWPPALAGDGRVWGAATQLYGVRSERNWGIGDYTDLAGIVQQWGSRGAGVVGVNPLHASFPHNPEHASPYSPSSRLFKNWIYIDVEACADFAQCEEARTQVRSAAFQARLRALREPVLVDYTGVAEAKRSVLETLYVHFRARHLAANDERAAQFRAFQTEGGRALRRHALFDALQEHLHRQDASIWGWPVWPETLKTADAPEVHRFCTEHLDRVEFFEYLQRRHVDPTKSGWASASTRISRSRSIAVAPKRGPIRTSTPSARASAHRPTIST
jgi:(1->4)-alpha-D-glucan 1-alpha-D-glucosylmutase